MISSVQYLRAIAALLVVHYHLIRMISDQLPEPMSFGATAGAFGVDLFFVISGFIMALTLAKRPETTGGSFIFRRIWRIAPIYYLFTLVIMLMMAASPSSFSNATYSFNKMVSSFLFLPYPNGDEASSPILSVGWTLSYEIFFYGLIALCLWLVPRFAIWGAAGILGVLVALSLFIDNPNPYFEFYSSSIVLEFIFGILVYQLWTHGFAALLNPLLAAMLIVASAFCVSFSQIDGEHVLRGIYWGIPAALILFGTLALPLTKLNWLSALGDWSYALYLSHLMVIGTILAANKWIGISIQESFILVYIVSACAAICFAGLTYTFIEKPLAKFGAKKLRQAQPLTI